MQLKLFKVNSDWMIKLNKSQTSFCKVIRLRRFHCNNIRKIIMFFFPVFSSLEQLGRHRSQIQTSKHDFAGRVESKLSGRICPDEEHQLPSIGSHPVLVRQQQRLLRLTQVRSPQWHRFVIRQIKFFLFENFFGTWTRFIRTALQVKFWWWENVVVLLMQSDILMSFSLKLIFGDSVIKKLQFLSLL